MVKEFEMTVEHVQGQVAISWRVRPSNGAARLMVDGILTAHEAMRIGEELLAAGKKAMAN